MQKHYIYKIECLVNGKVYIGQTKNKTKRLNEHKRQLRNNEHHSVHLQRAYNKYGRKNFSFEIIEECTKDNVDERERYWINYYNSTNVNFGYNMESGGNQNKRHHKLTKLKLREYALKTGRWRGRNNPNYGGHYWNDERRKYYSKMNEKLWTPEKKKQQSEIMKKVYNLDKALDSVRVKVVKLTLDGVYIDTFNSVTEAAKSVGVKTTGHISSCCKGKRRSAYGYVWVYLDDYLNGNYDINPSPLELNKNMKVVKLTLDNEYVGTYIYGEIKSPNKNKILSCIKGECKSTRGYKWMKYDDYIKMQKKS